MRLAVVGGKLQGTEAAYLAGEAGYDVVLVDRRPGRPAAGLAAESRVFDVTADQERARELFLSCDAVLPACEDARTLAFLASFVPRLGVPLLFDPDAYAVTQSKLRSNDLFTRLGVPRPAPWPCDFPVIVKPSVGSGSVQVELVWSEPELAQARARLAASGADAVIEEYVPGPSLSVDMVACGGETVTLAPTWLEFDAGWDCKRVVAPVAQAAKDPASQGGGSDLIDGAALAALDEVSRRLAGGVGRADVDGSDAGLRGVMDVEVMMGHAGVPKVLEIDARLPSQTPACAYHASDVNIVQLLVETFAAGAPPAGLASGPGATAARRGAVYEHVLVAEGRARVLGEHVVGAAGPLRRCEGLWGADVVLTDGPVERALGAKVVDLGEARKARVRSRSGGWVAVIMTRGETAAAAPPGGPAPLARRGRRRPPGGRVRPRRRARVRRAGSVVVDPASAVAPRRRRRPTRHDR
jgi:pyrrolysine biosynthesis protein PylC